MSTQVSTISPGLAPEYATGTAYAVGDVILHDNKYYRCKTAIQSAGQWNASQWEQIVKPLEKFPYSLYDSGNLTNRMIRYYRLTSTTGNTITLPGISTADNFITNLDVIVDATDLESTDPSISIDGGQNTAIITSGGTAINSVEKGKITILDFTSIPSFKYTENGNTISKAAWLVMVAGNFGKVATNA